MPRFIDIFENFVLAGKIWTPKNLNSIFFGPECDVASVTLQHGAMSLQAVEDKLKKM